VPVEPSPLWALTAPLAPQTPALTGERRADVAVIGAGYTGLSAALHLAEGGAEVAVLESAQPGAGASGRSGGQVVPLLKHDPDEIEAIYGPERGARIVELLKGCADLVFSLAERHHMECAPVRGGWLQLARTRAAARTLERRVAQWQRRQVPLRMLGRDEAIERSGSEAYVAALLHPGGGSVQPLAYTRGLARAAMGAGAAIHGDSPARALTREGGTWRVTTPRGAVLAGTVILATNAYTDGFWPGLERTLLAVNSFQIATEPLDKAHGDQILPGGEVASESHRVFVYFRKDPEGRLVMGGRGSFTQQERPGLYRHLYRAAAERYPQLRDASWPHRWAGRVALTPDHMPHLHEPAPGLLAALGYNGRGVAMATVFGKLLAERALGAPQDQIPFPFQPVRPIRLHGWHPPVLHLLVQWYRLRDALER